MTVNNLPLGLLKDILKITFLSAFYTKGWFYLQKYTNFNEIITVIQKPCFSCKNRLLIEFRTNATY